MDWVEHGDYYASDEWSTAWETAKDWNDADQWDEDEQWFTQDDYDAIQQGWYYDEDWQLADAQPWDWEDNGWSESGGGIAAE